MGAQMDSTTSRLMFASLALSTLATALASVPANATPPPVQLSKWLQSTPDRASLPCATAAPGTAQAPFFAFNGGTYDTCLIDGPSPWDNKSWFTMRIIGFVPGGGGPKADLI